MSDNPKWKPLLDALPEALHPVIKPHLTTWDQGVAEAFRERDEKIKAFDAFKPLIDNGVDPAYVLQAVQLADMVRDDPGEVVNRMNSTYELGYLSKEEAESLTPVTPDPDEDDSIDLEDGSSVKIEDHPLFKQMSAALDQMNTKFTEFTSAQEQKSQADEFDSYMKQLHADHGEFNDQLVTAFMTQGLDGPEAIEAVRKELAGLVAAGDTSNNQQTQEQATGTPPVVLGNGAAGSGTGASEQVNFGGMSKNSINDLVGQMLQKAGEAQQ